VLLMGDKDTLAQVERNVVEKPGAAPAASDAKLAALEETE